MSNQPIKGEKSRFKGGKQPLLNFIKTTIETIVEIDNQDPAFAFANNAASYIGVLLNNKGFVEDLKAVVEKPSLLSALKDFALEDLKNRTTNERLIIIFNRVWMSLLFDVSNYKEMKKELDQLDAK
jgi:hypothetical protein